MTVEQSPLERFSNQKPQRPPAVLDDKNAPSPTEGLIDLTNDTGEKEDDLKKAIALSLKEHERALGGQVTMEDQDISRVVEASLAESKAVGTKRKRGEVWQDPLNPNDRKRNGVWPVGLKNVGNTCWFSAVIQSLFHLPIFRKLVLNYSHRNWDPTSSDSKEKRNLLFMQELKKLFALLLCSQRKYVDPSHALDQLKEAFPDSSGTDSQQDVSEFSHKLLEWLEEAFKMNHQQLQTDDNGDSEMEGPELNPMLDLFYGHFLSEGQNEGHMFCNKETFGQYPLQVNGFNNIHDSLEAAMAQEIESYDVMTKSGQESWFTRLPPVLLFELSRFQFNQQLGRPEKIHHKLEFPEVMFMDRYMEQNKNTTRLIREKVRKLKEERDHLQTQLEKYMNFGSGTNKVPLHDVLQYSLEFAESHKNLEENLNEDVEMASPASVSSAGSDSSSDSQSKMVSMEVGGSSVSTNAVYEQTNHTVENTGPTPQHISELELKVLQSCLRRWRKEVETNVKSLQDNINNIDNTIKKIYEDSSLQKMPYRLHAVLVHEGQAASGHYWAYVYSPNKKTWLKFNDVAVSEATWTELQRDSMGGQYFASAYCLLYVDQSKPELFEEEISNVELGPDSIISLPDDLLEYVKADNESFELEIVMWEMEQSRKKDTSTMTADGDCTIIAEMKSSWRSGTTAPANSPHSSPRNGEKFDGQGNLGLHFCSHYSMTHAALLKQITLARIENLKIYPGGSAMETFKELVHQEVNRLRRLARLQASQHDDVRLYHIGIYILVNSASPDMYLEWSVMEQFLIEDLANTSNGSTIRDLAIQAIETMERTLSENHFEIYTKWHEEYHKFHLLIAKFVLGVDFFHESENYASALHCFVDACNMNATLMKLSGPKRGIDKKLLEHYRRQSCLRFNELIAKKFESANPKDALEALSAAFEYILPSMEFLMSPQADAIDNQVAEHIRNRWCSMLGVDIATPMQEKLQDFLAKLLDPNGDLPSQYFKPITNVPTNNLSEVYRNAIGTAIVSGEWDLSQKAK